MVERRKAAMAVLVDAFAMKGMKGGLNGGRPLVGQDTEEIDVLGVAATEKMSEILKDSKSSS